MEFDKFEETLTYENILVHIRQIHVYMQQILSLPPGELTMLILIDRFQKRNQKVLASDLVSELSLSRPAVSRMLHVLQKKELLCLKPNEKDHRCVEIILSEKGKTLLGQEYKECLEILERITEKLGREKMKQMIECNYQFCNELAKILEEKV